MNIKIFLEKSGYNESLSDHTFLIIVLIVGIIFLLLGLLFAWIYNHLKAGQKSYEKKFIHRHPLSIVGFWGRNRMKIIAFISGLFILIGLSLIVVFATGKMTPSSIII